ncbi:MAG: CotH kinase family protein [Chitinophagales bacterium]
MSRIVPIFFLITTLSLSTTSITAQQVRLNEVVSSNSTHFDEDGDSPDWFELHNTGGENISLENWTVTDDFNQPNKWTFPSKILTPNEHALVWASGKNRSIVGSHRTFISQGDVFRYKIPTTELSPQWTAVGFFDLTWEQGISGFGYGDNDDATLLPQGTQSVFLRKNFTLSNTEDIQFLILNIDYDDAFVAYINGKEIARANIFGTPPSFNAIAQEAHEAQMYVGGTLDRFVIDNPSELLKSGENVLSIQAHNASPTSSDFTLIPFLTMLYSKPSNEGKEPPSILSFARATLHTNFKISAQGETLYLFDSDKNLVDSIVVKNLPPDVSYGLPIDTSEPHYFETPTPGLPNTNTSYIGVNQANIEFSHLGGETESLNLTLSGVSPSSQIRYTLDATIPNENSPVYASPISINASTVVRARVFRQEHIPSPTQTHTYLVNRTHDLPIISLVTEPHNFFDNDTGIYVLGDAYEADLPHFGANFWEDWERPIHCSLYEVDGTLGLAFDGGTKIFGGWSRAQDQRPLSIFARNKYGLGEIDYPIFPQLDYTTFQSFVLRTSGNDWIKTMLRDAVLTGLMKGSGLDYQAYRPVATYLNGQYWGLYNIREKISEHFLAAKHGVHPDDIDLLEFNAQTIHGNNQEYLELIDFVESNSLVSAENYQFVADRIDIENFITYQTAQIYFDNTDWPGNNIKYWKAKGGKWRWILFDTDFGFGTWNSSDYQNNTLAFALESNGPGWPNPPWATLLLRKLSQNTGFRNLLVNRFADQLNSRFLANKIVEHIDTLTAPIISELPAHFARWMGNMEYWESQISKMKDFGLQRPTWLRQFIRDEFNLPTNHILTLQNNDTSKGYIQLNSLTIKENTWEGVYFEDAPIQVTAIPKKGYVFSHWTGANVPNDAHITVNMKNAMTLEPHFEVGEIEGEIVINEINYNSSEDFDTGDWIELYNSKSTAMNISNWIFKDDDDTHGFVLPEGTQIEANGYLILTRDSERFQELHPEIDESDIVGDFDFGLSSNGDAARLFDSEMLLQDEVYFLPDAPWSAAANGTGATLELKNPALDNSLPENWTNFNDLGSPNKINDIDDNIEAISQLQNLRYYPNPFTDKLHIDFSLQKTTHLKATLYHIDGSMAHSIFEGELNVGTHQLEANLKSLDKGLYLLQLVEGNANVTVLKWVKM